MGLVMNTGSKIVLHFTTSSCSNNNSQLLTFDKFSNFQFCFEERVSAISKVLQVYLPSMSYRSQKLKEGYLYIVCTISIKLNHFFLSNLQICSEIVSAIVSLFSSMYTIKWKEFFPQKELKHVPYFDGRAVCYPTSEILLDYLAWRQVDCEWLSSHLICKIIFWQQRCICMKKILKTCVIV